MPKKRKRTVRYIPCSQMPRDPSAHEEVEAFLLSMRDVSEAEAETIERYVRWLNWTRNRKDSRLPRY
jgi:hypothetical protein